MDGGVVLRMGVWYLGWMCGTLDGCVVPCTEGVGNWGKGGLVPEAGAVASSSADQRGPPRDRAPRPQGRDYCPAVGEGRVQAGCCCPGDRYPPERAVHRLRCCRHRLPSNEQKKTSKKKKAAKCKKCVW